jgi:hypothetical protein
MMSSLMQHGRAGAETTALAAELSATNRRFNDRYLNMKKDRSVSDDTFLELLDFAHEKMEMCEVAVQQFNSGGSASDLNQALIEIRTELENAAR